MNEKNWTVLLIEPNKFEAQIILDLLRNAGVDKVRVMADPAEALEVLELYNANIVITAFEQGPGGDAATWTKIFRRNHALANRKAAVFVTSGAFSRAMAEQCRHAGCNALIGKPISGKVLLATINKVLAQPRPFIDAEGYVGPCRRAGIVTAGAPKKRRKADDHVTAAPAATLDTIVEALATACAQAAIDPRKVDACETALKPVQSYAVNAGDGALMRACAAFALQLSSKNVRPEAARAAMEACVNGIVQLAALHMDKGEERNAIAESVRQAVGKAAMQRAA
jgi:CheY-like chemotaxis protein